MKTRVIHILSHSPAESAYDSSFSQSKNLLGSSNDDDINNYKKISYFPNMVGFFQNDWHVQLANSINEKNKNYIIECWRPYRGIRKIYSKRIRGIKHLIFPSIRIKFGKYKSNMIYGSGNAGFRICKTLSETNPPLQKQISY